MDVLIGTTNPSKVKRFETMLAGRDIRFLTPRELGIQPEPDEVGSTPEEIARAKAAFYGQYFPRVLCNDSGLYLDALKRDDPRQPGLHVRTPNGVRLDDEQMLAYYASLAHSLGGRALCYYLDGIAVYNQGRVYSFMEDSETTHASAFYLVDKPAAERRPGWPLDSISLNRSNNTYFIHRGNDKYDVSKENIIVGAYRERLVGFIVHALGNVEDDGDIGAPRPDDAPVCSTEQGKDGAISHKETIA